MSVHCFHEMEEEGDLGEEVSKILMRMKTEVAASPLSFWFVSGHI